MFQILIVIATVNPYDESSVVSCTSSVAVFASEAEADIAVRKIEADYSKASDATVRVTKLYGQ